MEFERKHIEKSTKAKGYRSIVGVIFDCDMSNLYDKIEQWNPDVLIVESKHVSDCMLSKNPILSNAITITTQAFSVDDLYSKIYSNEAYSTEENTCDSVYYVSPTYNTRFHMLHRAITSKYRRDVNYVTIRIDDFFNEFLIT